jgi:ABC-type Zn uptake system ZnuABC Zn-binding protein ZnuA
MMKQRSFLVGLALAAGLALASCDSSSPPAAAADGKLPVVTTTTMITDMVKDIGRPAPLQAFR